MVYRPIVPVLGQARSDQATFKVQCGRLAGLRGLWKAPCCSGGRPEMKRVDSDMYAYTCYVVLRNFSLAVLHDQDNLNHIHWLPSSINLLLWSMIFSQQRTLKVLYPLSISETNPTEKLSWPGTQHHRKKKKKSQSSRLMWTPPESELCFRCWAPPCPMAFPRQDTA